MKPESKEEILEFLEMHANRVNLEPNHDSSYRELVTAIERTTEVLGSSQTTSINDLHKNHLEKLYLLELMHFGRPTSVAIDLGSTIGDAVESGNGEVKEPVSFIGVIKAKDFINGRELAWMVDLKAGVAINDDTDWLKFYVGPDATCNKEGGKSYYLYTPMRPLRHNLSWDHINAAGVARGDVKTVSKDGRNYKVRLLSGGNTAVGQSNYYSTFTHPDHPMQSEWNQLIYRVHQMVPNGTAPRSGGPQIGDNWAEFTDAELGVNHLIEPYGSASWCMDDWIDDSSLRVARGYHSVAGGTVTTFSNVSTGTGWRPALIQMLG